MLKEFFKKEPKEEPEARIEELKRELKVLRNEYNPLHAQIEMLSNKARLTDFVPDKRKIQTQKLELLTQANPIKGKIHDICMEQLPKLKLPLLIKENIHDILLYLNGQRIKIPEDLQITIPFSCGKHTLKMPIYEILRYQSTLTEIHKLFNVWHSIIHNKDTITRGFLCEQCMKEKREKLARAISEGLRIPATLEEDNSNAFEILKQFQFDRYSPISEGSYVSETNLKKVISPTSKRYVNSQKNKIVIAEDALRITSTIDYNKRIPQGGVYFGVLKNERLSLEYVLGLLNSKLISFIYWVLFGGMHMGGGYLRYRTKFLEQLPIKVIQQDGQLPLIELVNEILFLRKRLNQFGDKITDERVKVEKEIDRVEDQIDKVIYSIYGLTDAEKEIIEKSLN